MKNKSSSIRKKRRRKKSKHTRPRLQHINYSWSYFYFITICTHQRTPIFGQIIQNKMILNPKGILARDCWDQIPLHFPHVEVDASVFMPDHFHGILTIKPEYTQDKLYDDPALCEAFGKPVSGSIPTVIRSFKSVVTKQINAACQTPGAKIWQSKYWDVLIRSQKHLRIVRRYIHNNPRKAKKYKDYLIEHGYF
jgi:putative transposase